MMKKTKMPTTEKRLAELQRIVRESLLIANEVSRRRDVLRAALDVVTDKFQAAENRCVTANALLLKARTRLADDQRHDAGEGR